MSTSPESHTPPDPSQDEQTDEIVEQAATWLVMLEHEQCNAADLQKFEEWQQQDPRHAQAILEMQQVMGYFQKARQEQHTSLPRQVLQQVIDNETAHQSATSRLGFNHLWLMMIGFMLVSLLTWHALPTEYWLADTRSNYHEWQQQTLSDQSEIKLGGKTAYNVKFDQQQRVIELIEGNIMVDVAKDSTRPFIVKTRYAQITALGTRFIVHQSNERTTLTMLHSATEVRTSDNNTTRVQAGQQVRIDANGLTLLSEIQPDSLDQAWQQHAIVVDKMPLNEVLDLLQSYQSRHLNYDAGQLKHIQVSAILPLDDNALILLQQSLDIQIESTLFNRVKITANSPPDRN